MENKTMAIFVMRIEAAKADAQPDEFKLPPREE